jgi:hypothetical protein
MFCQAFSAHSRDFSTPFKHNFSKKHDQHICKFTGVIEFLIKKDVHPRMFIAYNITGMANPFTPLGANMPNGVWTIGNKYFSSVDGFTTIEEMTDHYNTLTRGV